MSDIDKKIEELVFRKLRVRAKNRASSLKNEAKGYWHIDRQRFHELKARSVEFDRLASMFQEMWEDLPAYPALPEKEKSP